VLIVIGGATRLTESGLSITEWKPVGGILPPLDDAAWASEFERYQRIPQYTELNQGMSLAAFKRIYLWEYAHRLWARLVGLAFLVPYLVFLARGMVPAKMRGRLLVLLLLLALQGALGWFMVQSGLSERTSVSQYRLAAHLSAALLIYGATVWAAAGMFAPARRVQDAALSRLRRRAIAATALVALTAVAGAFVAGLRAGHAYNSFPLMGGRFVPDGYGRLSPWWRNLFESIPSVQFNHRLLAMLTAVGVLALVLSTRDTALPQPVRRGVAAVGVVTLLQFALGVITLVLVVPVVLGVMHQGGAVLLLTACLLLVHACGRIATE
jgi:cytochrome c oxidase assembly protein subunit 15